MSRPSHCEWRPFPGCDSCAYKGGDALRSEGGTAIPAHVCEVSAA